MVRFPLPSRPFPPLNLSVQDEHALAQLAEGVVTETLADYEQVFLRDNGVMDPARWKMLKRAENLGVYQERRLIDKRNRDPSLSRNAAQPVWFGTIESDLDDIMYGVVNQTAEMAKIKSTYVVDYVADFSLLASVVQATPEHPFQGLQVKWAANCGTPIMSRVIRPRDFVYLEATGITPSSSGERIGYHVIHSIEIPGAPELHDRKIVRANNSLYHVFRQKAPGVVEVFVKACIDVLGDMPSSMATYATVEAVASVKMVAVCSQLKKLNYLLSKSSAARTRKHRATSGEDPDCSVCLKDMRGPLRSKRYCEACGNRMCSRCHIPRKLSFLNRETRSAFQRQVSFCMRCVHAANALNGMDVAVDELRDENALSIYFDDRQTRSTSSASSGSIDQMC